MARSRSPVPKRWDCPDPSRLPGPLLLRRGQLDGRHAAAVTDVQTATGLIESIGHLTPSSRLSLNAWSCPPSLVDRLLKTSSRNQRGPLLGCLYCPSTPARAFAQQWQPGCHQESRVALQILGRSSKILPTSPSVSQRFPFSPFPPHYYSRFAS